MSKRPLIKALLIDISGNLHVGSAPTSGAVEAITKLRQSQIPFRLCSNASKESTTALVAKLNKMGFNFPAPPDNDSSATIDGIAEKEVWTSIGSMAQYVQEQGFRRPYMLLSESARTEVFPEVNSGGTAGSNSNYDAVLVGLAPGVFDYEHLNTAFRILKGENGSRSTVVSGSGIVDHVPLIATHKARFIEKNDPQGLSLGPGPFVTALEDATGRKAHIVGKPTQTFFQLVIDDLRLPSSSEGKIAVIGDDVEADLGEGALKLGLWRVLVKTGKYRTGDEHRAGIVAPDEVHETFASFVDDLLSTPTRMSGDKSSDQCIQM